MTILFKLKSSVNKEIDPELNENIIKKLLALFQKICPIELANKDSGSLVFKKTLLEDEFVYNFEYGEMRVTTHSAKLSVCIFFNNAFNNANVPLIPAGSQWCHIDVDNDLNYIKATFQSRFNFGQQIAHHANITRSSFYIDKSFNDQLELETELVYSLHGCERGGVHFNKIRFPKVFFENNNEFHAPLMKMLDCCSKKPDLFYDIFQEYPYHEEMIDDPAVFKSFLRLFHTQYKNSKKVLKSKVLLLDMQRI